MRASPLRLLAILFFALLLVLLLAAGAILYLLTGMPGESMEEPLPPLTAEQEALREHLAGHVAVLAGDIGERNSTRLPQLRQAADYIRANFEAMGYAVREQVFGGGFRNILVELDGAERAGEILVIGAHYDSAVGTPGADDNASGVAVLLETARLLRGRQFPRTIRLIVFPNEERPYFGTDLMGSRVSAGRARQAGEDIIGMISLEMLGYYSTRPGSQVYPEIIRPLYPEQGNFLAFVANMDSLGLLREAIAGFRAARALPSEGMAAPLWLVDDIRRSDNSAYWHFGYPALMLTDTSNFRNPHYHTEGDTPATLDYGRMARAVDGLVSMARALASPE